MPRRRTPSAAPHRAASPRGHRYAGASTNPLTPKQKGIIVMLARRAYSHRQIAGDFNAWRREEQERAIGHDSLTVATQADFNMLTAHFEGLAGEGGRQFKAALRDVDEVKRQQRHLLEDALNDRDLDLAYAEKICSVQYKRGLDDANPDQLARIKFTVENRRPKVASAAEAQNAGNPF